MRLRTLGIAAGSILYVASIYGAENAKPNFSGTWILDKEKSDMRAPQGGGGNHSQGHGMGGPHMGGGGWPGGGGMGGPRMGGTGMGIPGMGGPGMGGPGMGGPDWGGGTSSGGSSGRGSSQDEGQQGTRPRWGIPEKLTIEHVEPSLTVMRIVKLDGEAREQDSKYTTDGKSNINEMPDGRTIKSKTKWEGLQLVTKSEVDTPRGKMNLVETRTLSSDGKVMTVALETKGETGERTQHLIYQRETAGSETGSSKP
jgi:hypothetical protein